ncbi:hypothetical protein MILUP08_45502 [Micromonospora lupini str. Lupac 08]|uniref:Uncharacterized protein n=1 Tax=Micromonospora lupini str. Lupac 08 TaxID=1150864 RepID=I0L9X1_9ACTN|nr:hypothetical protein MILUP08_45502 [Micromonospora lupini str. Lupac 08]
MLMRHSRPGPPIVRREGLHAFWLAFPGLVHAAGTATASTGRPTGRRPAGPPRRDRADVAV